MCPRPGCQGLTVDHFLNGLAMHGKRCVNCGWQGLEEEVDQMAWTKEQREAHRQKMQEVWERRRAKAGQKPVSPRPVEPIRQAVEELELEDEDQDLDLRLKEVPSRLGGVDIGERVTDVIVHELEAMPSEATFKMPRDVKSVAAFVRTWERHYPTLTLLELALDEDTKTITAKLGATALVTTR